MSARGAAGPTAAYGTLGGDGLRQAAVSALGYLEKHRNPKGAWRYKPRGNDNDSSITISRGFLAA